MKRGSHVHLDQLGMPYFVDEDADQEMSAMKTLVETAFRLHAEKLLSRKDLVRVLQKCVNATAIENGYVDTHGLPFPEQHEVSDVP